VQNRNSLKLGQNYAYRNPKLLQLLGDFVPQTPYRGFAPGPNWGLLSPRPLHRTSPHILYQVYAPACGYGTRLPIYLRVLCDRSERKQVSISACWLVPAGRRCANTLMIMMMMRFLHLHPWMTKLR